MSKTFLNLGYCFFTCVQFNFSSCPKNVQNSKFRMIFAFLVMSKKFPQNFTSIHQLSLPSSTISSYFNSSYYSFFTFFTLYPIFFNISQKKFSPETQWGVLTPKPPLPTPLIPAIYNSNNCR